MKDLELTLILILGMALFLFGIQMFLQKDRRKVASEMIKAAILGMAGLFLIYFWQAETQGMSAGRLKPITPFGLGS